MSSSDGHTDIHSDEKTAHEIDKGELDDEVVHDQYNSRKAGIMARPADGEEFPDGGLRAWMVVLGGMCTTFSTFGFVTSWGALGISGLLRDYGAQYFFAVKSWIGSIQYALIFLPAIVVGRLFDLGYFRHVFMSSSAVLVASTFLIAQCTKYWHFLLCQGFAVGLACGGLYGPVIAVIAHWFKKRRGLAMGYIAIGSSIGGTVVPITAKNLIPAVGFPWTMRIIGFILIFTLGLGNLLLRSRLPPRKVSGGLLNLGAFRHMPYTLYSASAFFTFLGLFTALTYIDVSATKIGISSDFSFYFVAFANASSLFGRFAGGLVSRRFGSFNIMVPFTLLAATLTYAWPFARTEVSLIIVTIIYGFSTGAYIALSANPVMDLGVVDDVGRRVGMWLSILSIGALAGPPISGAINSATGGFEAVGYFAGSSVIIGVFFMCLTRQLILRQFIGKP